jgi:hypothetical protein
MTRPFQLGAIALVAFGLIGTEHASSAQPVPVLAKSKTTASALPSAAAAPTPPAVKQHLSLVPVGFRLAMTVSEVEAFCDALLDGDYRPLYKEVQPGIKMKELDAQLAEDKATFRRSKVVFATPPTAFDATALRDEYTYGAGEMLMTLERRGARRYFFFVRGILWKLYDALPFGQNEWCADDCGMWTGFPGVSDYWTGKLGVTGLAIGPDPSQQRRYAEVAWVDGSTKIRLVDRSADRRVALVLEDQALRQTSRR